MATKNCPHCQKQVPVACKKCGCGHVFFSSRRNVGREESTKDSPGAATEIIKEEKEIEPESLQPRRRTGRVQREKPQFYDALQYDNQMRKQKMLLRKQVKTSKPDDANGGSEDSPKPKDIVVKRDHDNDVGSSGSGGSKSQSAKNCPSQEESEPKKRRRGRPPGITGRKPGGGGARIHHNAPTLSNNIGDANQDRDAKEEEDEDIMADISPEKALQYHIVLQEINRKWAVAGWKAP